MHPSGKQQIRNCMLYCHVYRKTSHLEEWQLSCLFPLSAGIGSCYRNFGPENFGPLDRNFQWKNGPSGPIFSLKWSAPGNLVRVMQIGKTVCGTFNTYKEVFSLSTAPTFPHILVPIWNLSLTGWEVLSWDSARR